MCYCPQVVGTWHFKLSAPSGTSQRRMLQEDPHRMSCGHMTPDHPSTMYQKQYNYYDNVGFEVTDEIHVELANPNIAIMGDQRGIYHPKIYAYV